MTGKSTRRIDNDHGACQESPACSEKSLDNGDRTPTPLHPRLQDPRLGRFVVSGESTRRIAPTEDLEVLDGAVLVFCPHCRDSFQSKPGTLGKPRGRCQCGAWICPSCLYCQGAISDSTAPESCVYQRKRLVKKVAMAKRTKVRKSNSG